MTNMDYNEFEALLNDYLPEEGNSGSKVVGTIANKERNFVYLDVPGQITSVRVRAEEVADYNVGDEIEVMLVGETPEGEFIIGSRRKIEMEQGWDKLKEAFDKKETVTGKVLREVKGGYIVEIFSHQVFLPKSLSETRKGEDIIGKTVSVLVKEIKEDRKGKKVTVSRKDITMMEADKEFSELKEGDVIEGTVTEILPFGIVVEIGNLRGFIHISEISWKKAEKIEGFNIGDKLQVKVIGLEPEKKNVKLSLKSLVRNPWDIAAETVAVNSVVDGKITKILQYGVLVEIMDGVEGLIHISDFTWNRKKINVNEFAKVGDIVKVKVLEFKPESRKLKLGMKQLSVDPWAKAEENYKVGTKLAGKVAEIKPYGVFVEIEEGIDVFIHQSDFAWVGNKKFEKNDTVEFEVIELDLDEKKIKGSIKALEKSPWEKAMEEYKIGTIVEKPIKSILDFGMFVKLEEGIDGFIPTQLASKDFIKNLKDKFQVGDVVRGKIVEIDQDKERIKISIKGLELDEEKRETKELIEKYGVSSTEE